MAKFPKTLPPEIKIYDTMVAVARENAIGHFKNNRIKKSNIKIKKTDKFATISSLP